MILFVCFSASTVLFVGCVGSNKVRLSKNPLCSRRCTSCTGGVALREIGIHMTEHDLNLSTADPSVDELPAGSD